MVRTNEVVDKIVPANSPYSVSNLQSFYRFGVDKEGSDCVE